MIKYIYLREVISGNGYDIDNSARKDAEGNQVYLANEVTTAIPDKKFKLYCSGGDAVFVFALELNNEEKEILDALVYNHKHNL